MCTVENDASLYFHDLRMDYYSFLRQVCSWVLNMFMLIVIRLNLNIQAVWLRGPEKDNMKK